ncbi:MAG: glycosyltransferase family 2 protein [bacterium]|nr:glycosyltransferase family 2 protein [bacterium]
MKDINIVIVSYNSKAVLEPCLRSLLKDLPNHGGVEFQITVVDNASKDATPAFVRETFPSVVVIEQGNLGYAGGVNRGIEACDSRYHFILNPDTEVIEPNTISRLVAWMDGHLKVGMASPKLLNADGSIQDSCGRFPRPFDPLLKRLFMSKYSWAKRRIAYTHMHDFDHNATQPVDWVIGSAMLVRREALEHVGAMDRRFFMYFEDMDWCRRFWEKHLPVYYIHDISMRHLHKRESAQVSGAKAVLLNPLTRIHLMSWWKYFRKYKFQVGP